MLLKFKVWTLFTNVGTSCIKRSDTAQMSGVSFFFFFLHVVTFCALLLDTNHRPEIAVHAECETNFTL